MNLKIKVLIFVAVTIAVAVISLSSTQFQNDFGLTPEEFRDKYNNAWVGESKIIYAQKGKKGSVSFSLNNGTMLVAFVDDLSGKIILLTVYPEDKKYFENYANLEDTCKKTLYCISKFHVLDFNGLGNFFQNNNLEEVEDENIDAYIDYFIYETRSGVSLRKFYYNENSKERKIDSILIDF